MIAGFHIPNHFRSFKRARISRMAVVALLLMPLLYSALYLAAFWDPFAKVNALPVALVNSDEGAVQDGKVINAGDKVVEGLQNSNRIQWQMTNEEDARKGVANGKYYFSLELPKDFSAAVTSPSSQDPRKANLIATYNDTNGYLSTVIGQNVMREVLNTVGDKISAQAVDKVLIGVLDSGKGIERAAVGATQLADGTSQLKDGSAKLNDGAHRLNDGLGQAKDGSTQLVNGANQLVDGTGQLKNGIGRLQDGSGQLADGTQQLNDQVQNAAGQLTRLTGGIAQLGGGADQLGAGATQINDGVQQLRNNVAGVTQAQSQQAANLRNLANGLRTIPGPQAQDAANQLENLAKTADTTGLGAQAPLTQDLNRLADGTSQLAYQLSDPRAEFRGGLNQLQSGTNQLPGKLGDLQNGVARINDGAHQLHDGLNQAAGGVDRLDNGAQRLNDGTKRLDEGNAKLLDGSRQLTDGTTRAVDGSNRLNNGATQLRDGLVNGVNRVPKWNDGQRVATAAAIGGPVDLKASNDSGTNTFGAGLAPLFFSMALFIAGIIVYTLIAPLQARAINAGLSPLRAALDGFLPTGIIAILQSAVVVAVTVFAVGLHPANLPGLFAFGALVALVFMLINQMFSVVFGAGPGRVAGLAFLMLQVVSSGGLYPVETQSSFFRFFHPINPMTYTVNGFRQVIYGVYDHRMWTAIAVLIGLGIATMAVTAIATARKRTWTMKRLHPVLNA
ncbi:YhgE/Pip domain-containing protein [Corynebacterium heidelbergense]|uniref:YhgE/Pip domain-containing protein n=1 Tax=Corynebacterium heidelbergense TaxID=2055947 RepID=A0A364VE20_9CORY|nr:YhgE/Pip domain-containing protein [Corynebacterium heidelbergense]RAV34806.1 YhgE/Pip domain-containing protein [Corynebacterium heidelbergense]WCZ37220.1 Chromosome partition protein Smc [Corynebacterium heidelbergense]